MLVIEGLVITVLGTLAGVVLVWTLSAAIGPIVEQHYGFVIQPALIAGGELPLLGAVIFVGLLASLAPGYRAYRLSLSDGLLPRI